jgi:hypothetical protein
MSAFPTAVSAIEVTVGANVVLAFEGVSGGGWLGGKPARALQFCVAELRSKGCDAFDVTAVDGCVAITDDGGCSYETKATNAAAAGAAGILVVADDDTLSVMGCKTCQLLQLFGSMISRSDGDRLRRVVDADSSARIMCASTRVAAAAGKALHPSTPGASSHAQLRRFTSAQQPPSALAIDSSGCARQVPLVSLIMA